MKKRFAPVVAVLIASMIAALALTVSPAAAHDGDDAHNALDRREHRQAHRSEKAAVLAEALGIEVEDLRTQLKAGASLAEIAEANDVDPQNVIDAIVTKMTERMTERINTAVENGRLTQEQAGTILAMAEERANAKVNGTYGKGAGKGFDKGFGGKGFGHRGLGKHFGHRGFGGADSGTSSNTAIPAALAA